MASPPENWKYRALGPPAETVTVAAQGQLPRLPVPELKDTFARLRRSLKPLAKSDEELAETEKKVKKFEDGLATVLQERLLKRQKETLHWLEEWWDAGAYNGYRDSVRSHDRFLVALAS
jgi:carnitine O-acetyltransferase